MLEIDHLGKSYAGPRGTVTALADVSLHMQPGEFVAVRGPSGSGKSTLLLAAGGLLHPDGGRVRVDGQDLYALSPEARARFRAANIGFVFQQFHLIPYLSVLDNVLAPSLAAPRPDARARALELLARLGLTDRAPHLASELSTGERQRTALARALLNRPRLILADEPTGNLDEVNGQAVLAELAEFARGGGSVLLVTHDSRAADYAQRSLALPPASVGPRPKQNVRAARGHFGMLSNGLLMACLSLLALAVLGLLLWSPWDRPGIASGTTLRLYCAAGMARPVAEILKEYEDAHGVSVQATYAGSGKLLSVMRTAQGEGDLYLAADADHMRKAQQQGLVAEVIPVAVLRPVLVVNARTQQQLRAQGKPVTGLKDLLRDDLKVVLANPEVAAIGQLTRAVLARPGVGLWPALEKRLKEGAAQVSTVGTVNEVAQVVHMRDGYAGVVWSAVAAQFDGLETVPVPEFAGITENMQIGVLTHAKNPTAALQFARYLTARDRGLSAFARHHFEPLPDADVWEERPTLHLAAGAMLKPGIEDTVKAFAEREGVVINTSFAGCGLLVAEMRGIKAGQKPGNFPDAYFACDMTFLDMVQQWFDAAALVSKNDMVLIVPKGNPRGVKSLEDLARPELQVGLAHPEKAAIGKLTDDLLRKVGLHGRVYAPGRPRPVVHTDASHMLVNQMRTGALDLAVVYRSNALSTPENVAKYLDVIDLDIPGALATQPFAIAKDSPHRYLMQRLLRALVAGQSADHFRALGFHWVYESR